MKPQKVNGMDLAFGPRNLNALMPKDIPEEFMNGHTKGNKFFSDLFFFGIDPSGLIPKEGIDKGEALCHIRAVAGSFEPKHERKEAAVAYLFSIWFRPESTW